MPTQAGDHTDITTDNILETPRGLSTRSRVTRSSVKKKMAEDQAEAQAPTSAPSSSSSSSSSESSKAPHFLAGFAGVGPNLSFFESPKWVDEVNKPGTTPQPVALDGWWKPIITGWYLFFSPNLVWLIIALGSYFLFPYDLEAAKSFESVSWITHRLLINTGIVLSYFGFWHVVLYFFNWAQRPFNNNRTYKWGKVIHNVWYTTLGAVQWTAWEAIFMYCYATGRLPYLSDEAALYSGNNWNLFMFIAGCFFVPVWRELHFYFAHRFIHIKALYKYVHSLHHRNTDVEPFSGLCMHPVEHLYYYSCIAPSLLMFASPFMFMWNGVHLLISPAASHSGWEDHFQSDQYHYLHHRYFECNYGTGGTPLDKWFGTFRDKLTEKKGASSYKGGADHVSIKQAAAHDAKATLAGLPSFEFSFFMAANCAVWMALWFALRHEHGVDQWNPHALAFAVAFGPILLGQLMTSMTERVKKPLLYPFHKDSSVVALGHVLMSTLLTAVPTYLTVHMALSPPGASAYCMVYGC